MFRTTTQTSNCLSVATVLRPVLLLVLLAWPVSSVRGTQTAELVPETESEEFLGKRSYHGTQNLLWHLMRSSLFGQLGGIIKNSKKENSRMLKKNSERMSLTDLADILSSIKQKYETSVNMRMPSLRFG